MNSIKIGNSEIRVGDYIDIYGQIREIKDLNIFENCIVVSGDGWADLVAESKNRIAG